MTPRSWLLVYLADPKTGLDKTNDPELRMKPMTWGVCRPATRRYVSVGDDLWFLACAADQPLPDRYRLTARFHVAEKLDLPAAVERFGGRENVIVEARPGGEYVHAPHDHHSDWAHRIAAPYVVADTVTSRTLDIPYAALAANCPALPQPGALRTEGRPPRHHHRILKPEASAYLLSVTP
jgi:hypothetical protein